MESDDRVVYLAYEYKSIINVVDGVHVQFTSLTFGQRKRGFFFEAKVYVAHIFEINIVDDGNQVNWLVVQV